MLIYNWQFDDWPQFTFDSTVLEEKLLLFAEKTGHLTGILKALPDGMQVEALVDVMVAEAIKTSEIEGEFVSRRDVMSSIKNNLGLNKQPEKVNDRKAEGVGELMYTIRQTYKEPLSKKMLFDWHSKLMAAYTDVTQGAWRKHEEPMQVVSGALGKQKVHFEAPPSDRVPREMELFIKWFNNTAPGNKLEISKPAVRAALVHLYFESIHPFEDGNGRIGRALAEKALSQGIGRPVLLSLSKAMEANKKMYYSALQKAQRSNQVTDWVKYFLDTVLQAQSEAERQIEFTLQKSKYFDQFKTLLSERQLKVISRMLEAGPDGFEGGMNAGKYVSLAKVSKATATRDLQDLLDKGAIKLLGDAGGRSTSYVVNINVPN